MKEHMWARCLNSTGAKYLENNKEYHVVKIETYKGFGESVFYILENGLAYSSIHFTVTYLLNREIGNDF